MKHKFTQTYKQITDSTYTNWILIAVLIAITMFIAVHARTGAVDLEFADNYANNVVDNNVRSQITQQVNSQNPLLSDARKNQLIEQAYNNYIKENSAQIETEKANFADQLKTQFQNDDGQTYLIAIDPYFYFRYYENIIETGQPGEYTKVVDGEERSYTNFLRAPNERDVTNLGNDFHVYFSVWIYKFVNFFKDVSPLTIFFMIPAIFAALMCIPAFFVGKEFGGNLGGFLLAFLLGTNSAILSRTPAGFSDTDIYAFFFPMVVLLFAIHSLKVKTIKWQLINAGIAGFSLAVFATAWAGWWNIIYFIGALYGTYFLVKVITYFKEYKKHHKTFKKIDWKVLSKTLYQPVAFLLALSIFTTLFGKNFFSIIQGALGFLSFGQIKNATLVDLWPNVFTTVAELSAGSFNQIVTSAKIGIIPGGFVLLIIAIGLALYLWKGKQEFAFRLAIVAMVITWFIAISYATTKGIRFLMFTAIPISIGAAIALNAMTNFITRISHSELNIPKSVAKSLIVIVLLLLVVMPVTNNAFASRTQQLPSMNDGWYNTLTQIKENSEPDAIISSWWDFGHWFITIADRGATADGANQNTPQAHWLGKLLLTDSVKESTDVLRMLNCGGNNAYDATVQVTNDSLEAKKLVDSIIIQDKENASATLREKNFTETQIENVTQYTHCEAPESFLITSEDMGCLSNGQGCSGKTGVWAHFGGWNFTKAKMWNIVSSNRPTQARELLVTENLATESEARSLVAELSTFTQDQANSWIYGWPGYVTPMMPCQNTNGTLQCQNGGVIPLNDLSQSSIQVQQGRISANSIVFVDAENGYQVAEIDAESPYSMVIRQQNGNFEMMLASPEIAKSTFTRLFYLENGGEYYEKFSDVRDVQGQRIIVWKVVEE